MMLLNMKMTPSCLKTRDDLKKFGAMIKTYLCNGGKHIQFNVVNKQQLEEAQAKPEENSQLMVRIAGYSTYFLALNHAMQEEVKARTEQIL